MVSVALSFSQHLAIGAKLIMFHKTAAHVSAPHQEIPTGSTLPWPFDLLSLDLHEPPDHLVMQRRSQCVAMQFAVPNYSNVHTAVM